MCITDGCSLWVGIPIWGAMLAALVSMFREHLGCASIHDHVTRASPQLANRASGVRSIDVSWQICGVTKHTEPGSA
jgi:hypothetical protein